MHQLYPSVNIIELYVEKVQGEFSRMLDLDNESTGFMSPVPHIPPQCGSIWLRILCPIWFDLAAYFGRLGHQLRASLLVTHFVVLTVRIYMESTEVVYSLPPE